ncbi:MAG TPA: hypothetical protein VMU33_11335 [Burkholderiaceae bacterium]|nr:hypothetical protein [Burkholderiaceae bacterium]
MFDTPVINVAIGLVFCFAAMSLAASTVTEALASLVKLRANTLVTGVQQMLNDPQFSDLALKVYRHALVHPQGDGHMQSRSRFWTYDGPSYIKAENFATALVDVLQGASSDMAGLRDAVDRIQDAQIKQLLGGMLARAGNDADKVRAQVAAWFDTAMERVSGAYKRQAQLICFLAALAMSAAMNVDATHVVTTLWANPDRAREVAVQLGQHGAGDPQVAATMDQLAQLPIGYDVLPACDTPARVACVRDHGVPGVTLLGWLVTAVASVFGAPFWFDLLGKLVQLRGSGPKPG